ncbi:restriction endonuclease [Anabaena sp. CCY 0017]|uniref:restriction endonuclease n=1 Tax=Anabaena sp. CCY 0017 TaxID=3103866 RepID=UPI0039C5FEF9
MNTLSNINKKLKVVVPKHWSNDKKGKFWEKIIAPLFIELRCEPISNIEFEGMQTDIYVKDLLTGKTGLVECKFHEKHISPDIIHQLMGQADDEGVEYAYLISTSELTPKAKAVMERQEKKTKNQRYNLLFWGPDTLADLFIKLQNIPLPDFTKLNIDTKKIKQLTLLLTQAEDFWWIADEMGQDGDINRAIIFSIRNQNLSINEWKEYFYQHSLYWSSLDIAVVNDGENIFQNNAPLENIDITISEINEADSFDDYHRPCRPEDFFGMNNTQDKFWDFVKKVRDNKTKLRILCFSGKTGIGKSSLVIKLASDCLDTPEYQNSFYIYHVDVTSVDPAQSTLFIPSIITKALQTAIDNKFIEIQNHKISTNLEPQFFATESIRLIFDHLKKNNKILILFFDQFEEIIMKENLSPLFDIFKRLVYEVDSLKENIVLGFSWRNDLYIPMDDPRYYSWQELEKISKKIEFDDFSNQDALKLLDRFSEYLKQNGKDLDQKIKNWLYENCQNLPWLLKKLCSDIYNQNIDQRQISSGNKNLINKFDIKKIFDADIQRYVNNNPEYYNCLEFIAKQSIQSTVSKSEVCDKFNPDVINRLVKAKLIIETGKNYKIYWDIFREFIIDGTLPKITITYRFRTRISTLFNVFRLIQPTTTIVELIEKTKNVELTVINAIQDLQNFFQVEKDIESNKIIAPENLVPLQDYELAEYLADQIEDHIIIREIYETLLPDQYIWDDEFKDLVRKRYGILKPKTAKDYSSKMLSWFCFTGLLEIRQTRLIARPIRARDGQQKGKLAECEFDKPKIHKSYITPGQTSFLD